MDANQFSRILGEELKHLDNTNVDFRGFWNAPWEVDEDDTPEQVRAYIRSNLLDAAKEQAARQLNSNHGEKIETMWRDAIQSLTDSPETDVKKMFGKKEDEPLGGITDEQYKITALMNGVSEQELRRRVDDYRKEKQGTIAKGAEEDRIAETNYAPYKLAKDYREGKLDGSVLGTVARTAYGLLRPMTEQAYLEETINKEGDDDVSTSLLPTSRRGRANMVETGMDFATGANPAGRAASRILPEKLSGVGKKRVMIAASAPYTVGPMQDAAIDAAGQGILAATDDREYDPNQTAAVLGSSATLPSLMATVTMPMQQMAGAPRQFARDFQQGLRKGENNRANEVLKIAEANEKGKKLKKDFDNPKLSKTQQNKAAEINQKNQKQIEAEFPTLEGIYNAEDWKALTGGIDFGKEVAENKSLAAHASGIQNPEHFTDAEYTLFDANYKEPPVGISGKAGSVLGTAVSPISQQAARAKVVGDNEQDYKQTDWYKKMSKSAREAFDKFVKQQDKADED